MEKSDSLVKVVVHFNDGALTKGFFDDAQGVVRHAFESGEGTLPSNLVDLKLQAGGAATVDLGKAKAVFFVKTFEGRTDYNEIKFFQASPAIAGLWVRVRYADSEICEGIVHNSLDFIRKPGFFMKPPDPQSNNRMVYVVKKFLVDFEVLGIQAEF